MGSATRWKAGEVTIVRSGAHARFPARPLIVAAMNPCACGWLGHPKRGCKCGLQSFCVTPPRSPARSWIGWTCRSRCVRSRRKNSWPRHTVSPPRPCAAACSPRARCSAAAGYLNAQLPAPALREHCLLDGTGRQLVADAIDRGGISARAVHRAIARGPERSRTSRASSAWAYSGSRRRSSIARTRGGRVPRCSSCLAGLFADHAVRGHEAA